MNKNSFLKRAVQALSGTILVFIAGFLMMGVVIGREDFLRYTLIPNSPLISNLDDSLVQFGFFFGIPMFSLILLILSFWLFNLSSKDRY